MNEFRLELPWPIKALSPNARPGVYQKANAAKAAKNTAFFMAKEQGVAGFKYGEDSEFTLELIVHPPDRRFRDQDNVKASLKPYIDGLMFAVGADDARITDSHTFAFLPPVKGGKIILVLGERRTGKLWKCTGCERPLGIVMKKASGSHVLIIDQAGIHAEIDSGSIICPFCKHERKFVMGEARMNELLWNRSRSRKQ